MLFTALISLYFSFAHAAVWETTQQWSPAWENQYSDWVRNNWQTDVFRKSNSDYPGLYPDCADTVYSMRIIFASKNGLPFAVLNPNTNNSLISNQVTKFDSLPAGKKRVTAFLNWIFDVLSTKTLPNDSIPVAINRNSVRPGGFMLAFESKHSYTIKKIRDTGVPVLYYSTQANDGELKERSWPSVEYLFSQGVKAPSGIRYFRKPSDLLKNAWDVPGYSEEQYQVPAKKWIKTMQSKLSLRQESHEEAILRSMHDVCELLNTRIELVRKGVAKNNELGETCMNAHDFDDLSTPSRDRQAAAAYSDLANHFRAAIAANAKLSTKVQEQVRNIFARSASEERGAQYCVLSISNNRKITLGEYLRRQKAGLISSNPNDPFSIRWGEARGPSPKAARCPIY